MKIVLATGTLKKKLDGKTTQQKDYTVTILKEKHMNQIMGLQATIVQNLDRPELMEPIPFVFMKSHIERQGFILGTFVEHRLIAYRIVYFPQSQDKLFNMGFDIGLDEDQRSKVANFQMVCVHPRFRGNALGSTLNRLALRILGEQHTCEHVFATVSPYNVWNIRILLNSGFRITTLKFKYGGKLRYIVYQKLRTPIEFVDEAFYYTPLEDFDTQKEIFESGLYGVALAQKQDIDSGTKKDPTLHNYIIFKRPLGQQAVYPTKRGQQSGESTTVTTFPSWHPDLPSASQWDIAGDRSVFAGSAYSLDHPYLKVIPT